MRDIAKVSRARPESPRLHHTNKELPVAAARPVKVIVRVFVGDELPTKPAETSLAATTVHLVAPVDLDHKEG